MANEGATQRGERLRWVEIAIRARRQRFEDLSSALNEAGLGNEVSFIETSEDEFPTVLEQAKADFDQIRIGGDLQVLAPKVADRLPSLLLTLRAADALVKEGDQWWLRNYFVEGLQEAIAGEIRNIDLTGGSFILGATAEARAAVAALVRFGFHRLDVSDPDEERAKALVEELRSTYFKVQFQFIPRHLITQLPGIHTMVINTLEVGDDDGILGEMAYFNFLKPGGVWLDLPLVRRNSALESEARSVGAVIESAASVHARTDRLWAQACFDRRLSASLVSGAQAEKWFEALRERYDRLTAHE